MAVAENRVSFKNLEEYVTFRQYRVFRQRWMPSDGAITHAFFVVHGVHEHSSRYAHLAPQIVNARGALFSLDLPGHGRTTGGKVAIINDMNTEVVDLFMEYIREVTAPGTPLAGVPFFVLGHSMGGCIAPLISRRCRDNHSFRGLILSNPVVDLAEKGVALKFIRVLSACLPRIPTQGVAPKWLCTDPKVVSNYVQDSLNNHRAIRARTANAMLRATVEIGQNIAQDTFPVLVLVAPNDHVVDARGTIRYFGRCPSADKQMRQYPALLHELLNEPQGPAILGEILEWARQHIN
ncbi:putative alpha/beta hydrolase [Paratrimastix pyriformis]|uniref:Alpha/beta hydrolase n=1 Tax=Paratrimastix pyriformis TaxID=342808 RepID=A0ABQ8UHB1_9EUKA|nr:putative alpha/beta hydrolase [Paratrimastix pyriformis]|eukprot:GAFH01003006.1.p1 GENE.GAFH01003006.1~~GAFH01003006.1.p1  ORF type:complete len:293 (-),score=37.16 GAFH01003006.1:144-1022(-)